jgi:large subunit ribosomal protein L6
MSRIGKIPIPIPNGVEVAVDKGVVKVKGPKGSLSKPLVGNIEIANDKAQLTVTARDESRETNAYHGLMRTLVNNMVVGVTSGFKKELQIVGVGYKAENKGNNLVISVGYSHPVEFIPPAGITAKASKTGLIEIEGIDKELVGDVAAKIRRIRPPDSYKGKGIRYMGEVVKLKPGKSAAAKG